MWDESSLTATQRLVGPVFEHRDSLAPIDDQLLGYVLKTARLAQVANYIDQAARMAGTSGLEADALRGVAKRLDRLAPHAQACFPMSIVHGDLSHHNIVRNADGDAFLIDFDRSFEASAYYDFIRLGLRGGFEGSSRYVIAINEHLMPQARFSHDEALRYALAFFVLDNILYLGQQQSIVSSSKAFTQRAIVRALQAPWEVGLAR